MSKVAVVDNSRQIVVDSCRKVVVIPQRGVQGIKGDAGIYSPFEISANFNDLSPITIGQLTAGSIIIAAWVNVLEAWDGDNAYFTVGTDSAPDKYIKQSDLSLNQLTNIVAINQQLIEHETIKLFITPGFLQTTGKVFIRFETKEAI